MGAEAGDSGALVFAVDSTTREARGILSANASSGNNIFWTEAPDIFNHFQFLMDPHY